MTMYDYDDLTPEECNSQMLLDNPHIESALWAEWVSVVCGWELINHPTNEEWAFLRSNFYHNKAPIDSVAELKELRRRSNNE